MMKTKRLEILEKSLAKKEAVLYWKVEEHFTTTQQVLRQPLNDKKIEKSLWHVGKDKAIACKS